MFVHNPQRKLIARALPWSGALEASVPPTSLLFAGVSPARELGGMASSSRRFRLPHAVERAKPMAPRLRLPLSRRDRADGSLRAAHLLASRRLDRSFARQMAGAGAAATICSLGFAGALARWTPLPAQIAARALEERGFRIDGITGSYRSGYRVDSVSRPGVAFGFELRGLRFRTRLRLEDGGRLTIELVETSADSARLTLNEVGLRSLAEGAALSAMTGKAAGGNLEPANDAETALWRARAETIEIGETVVRTRSESGEEKEHAAERLFVSGVEWGAGEANSMRFDRIWLQSGPLDFDAPRFSFSDGEATFAQGTYLRARPQLAPSALKSEIEARFSGVVRDGAWTGEVIARADASGRRLGCANAGRSLGETVWQATLASLCPPSAAPRAVAAPSRPVVPVAAAPSDSPFSELAGPETAESPAAPPPIVRLPAYAPPAKPE